MRTFFALELGAAARLAAADVVRALRARPGGEGVRWVRPETLHVTLRFLGETPSAALGALVRLVAGQASALPPFTLGLGGVRAFPSPRRPRVVALHVAPEAPVVALAAAVEAGAVAAGFSAEPRPFRAHVTLGRIDLRGRSDSRAEQTRARAARGLSLDSLASPPPSPFEVREIVLLESRPGPDGSVYTPLERIALGCGAAPCAAPAHDVHPHSGDPEETPHGDDRHHSR